MGQKDISEKILMNYNDVFADIINGLVYRGEQVVVADKLSDAIIHSQYKDDKGELHEDERDVAKYWKQHNINLAVFGIENQTRIDKNIPFRLFSYDGAKYKEQYMREETIAPVVSIVLYFGKEHWSEKKNIKSLMQIPKELDGFVNDYQIHVFEVSWLTEEQIALFHSDFQAVARFFVEKRKNSDYIPTDQTELKHVDAVLKLLSVMTQDDRYEEMVNTGESKEVRTMCEVYDKVYDRALRKGEERGIQIGEERGIQIGEERGEKRGEKKLGDLMSLLLNKGRIAEAQRASTDEVYREQLYLEYGISDVVKKIDNEV